ncbi:helix-turn-helix domain-containing protein [Aneurinibacillus migulanus]|uniref:helix-turn-helix domain-containing protein n=1 Tax=Aneurinibacillus migulanus TaxID=47500 RepID=UPI00069622B8|nr:helix-turn-helix transcriptional regulator [Aneurinibacillus migulanus]CEH30247.1 DNA-binding helix-turn-helix protein [Aneurinibacillus migulanus]
MGFKERLKELRSKKGLTQEQLAISLDIPESTIRRYESVDDSMPRRERLEKIADFFDVQTDYLTGRTDNPSSKKDKDDSKINVAFYDGLKGLEDLDPDEQQFILDMVEDTVARFKKRKAELKAKKNK